MLYNIDSKVSIKTIKIEFFLKNSKNVMDNPRFNLLLFVSYTIETRTIQCQINGSHRRSSTTTSERM